MSERAALLDLLGELRAAAIHFELFSYRDDAITVVATVPGERWEIEVGVVQFERFTGSGAIEDREGLAVAIQAQRA